MVTFNLIFFTILFLGTAIGWLLTGEQSRKSLLFILNQIALFMIFRIITDPVFACIALLISVVIIVLPLFIFADERQFVISRKNNIVLYIAAGSGLILFILLFIALINIIQVPSLTLKTDPAINELSELIWILLILLPLVFIQFYLLIRKIGNENA